MSIQAACCLNLFSPPTKPSSKTQLNPWVRHKGACRSHGVVGAACIAIGLALTNQTCQDLTLTLTPNNHTNFTEEASMPVQHSQGMRWSDKRACPPWSINSFELNVPENLPRPRSHRKWAPAGYDSGADHIEQGSASSVRVIAKANSTCFSM